MKLAGSPPLSRTGVQKRDIVIELSISLHS